MVDNFSAEKENYGQLMINLSLKDDKFPILFYNKFNYKIKNISTTLKDCLIFLLKLHFQKLVGLLVTNVSLKDDKFLIIN